MNWWKARSARTRGILAVIGLLLIYGAVSPKASSTTTATTTSARATAPVSAVAQTPAITAAVATTPPRATRSPSPTPTPQPKIGDTVRHGNWEYTVTAVERSQSVTWSSFGNVEAAKGVWVIVSLALKNIGDRNFGIAEHDFELHDGTGIRYDACDTFACSMYLSHNKLSRLGSFEQFPPGVETRTALLFDLNPSASGLRLVLKQGRDATIALD